MKPDRWYVQARDTRRAENEWGPAVECASRADARRLRDEYQTEGLLEARILQYEFKGVVR